MAFSYTIGLIKRINVYCSSYRNNKHWWVALFLLSGNSPYRGSWGQHGAHLGPTGPRLAPCWPHELCYLGTSAYFLPVVENALPRYLWILHLNISHEKKGKIHRSVNNVHACLLSFWPHLFGITQYTHLWRTNYYCNLLIQPFRLPKWGTINGHGHKCQIKGFRVNESTTQLSMIRTICKFIGTPGQFYPFQNKYKYSVSIQDTRYIMVEYSLILKKVRHQKNWIMFRFST